jgi:nucleoside-diphosphate-sugar epimerase
LISVDELVSIAEEIGNVKLTRKYDTTAPRGVAGRNSDNAFIKQVLNWEPRTQFKDGLTQTYKWIESQYMARKAGQRVVEETF